MSSLPANAATTNPEFLRAQKQLGRFPWEACAKGDRPWPLDFTRASASVVAERRLVVECPHGTRRRGAAAGALGRRPAVGPRQCAAHLHRGQRIWAAQNRPLRSGVSATTNSSKRSRAAAWGSFYKARQISLNRPVALKMILAGQWAGPEARQRFRAEAEAAANLQHPNIVAIHEVGERHGQQYFTMDFVAGKNLAALVRDHPLSAERAAAYVKMIAEAVHFAHQHGIAAPRLEAPKRADRYGRSAADHRFWTCQTHRDREWPHADGRRAWQSELHAA